MLFKPDNDSEAGKYANLVIGKYKLEQTTLVKYLGLQGDDKLSWQPHVEEICKRVSTFIGIFYKIRNKLSQEAKRTLYFATVFPIIQYGVELYASCNYTTLKPILTLNNKK